MVKHDALRVRAPEKGPQSAIRLTAVLLHSLELRQQLRISYFGEVRLAAYRDVNVEHRL